MKALAWFDRNSPMAPLLLVVGTFALAALVAAVGRVPEAVIQPTPPLPILYLPTIVPTMQPTPDTQVLLELAALRTRVAELEAERSVPAPQPVYVEMAAPQAAPTMPPPEPAEAPQLQTFSVPEEEEPLSDAQMREAQDQ